MGEDQSTDDFSSDSIGSAVDQAYGKTAPSAASPYASKSKYAKLYADAGKKYGIDPALIEGVATHESSENPQAISKDENGKPVAHGLMQLTPPTSAALGVKNPYNPAQSVDAGARLLKTNLDASGGDVPTALKMYHGGPDQSNWGPKTNAYPAQVMASMPKTAQTTPDYSSDFSTDAIASEVNKAYGSSDTTAHAKPDSNGVAQGKRIATAGSDLLANSNFATIGPKVTAGAGEAALQMGSGIIASAGGGLAGLAAGATSLLKGKGWDKSVQDATDTISAAQEANTYQPRTTGGKLFSEVASVPLNAIKEGTSSIGGDVGQTVGGDSGRLKGEAIGGVVPDIYATIQGGRGASNFIKSKLPQTVPVSDITQNLNQPAPPRIEPTLAKPRYKLVDGKPVPVDAQGNPVAPVAPTAAPDAPGVTAPAEAASSAQSTLNGVGAAESTYAKQAEASGASPQIVSAIAKAERDGQLNTTAASRHIEAGSLPVPVELTAGQATGDVNLLSHEQNLRGKQPALAQRFNEQNGQLIQNINAIRDAAGPDVYAVDHVENGQSLIDSYKNKDAALNADISAKYKALEEANGGQFPVDGKAFVNAANDALAKKMKGRYVPPEIQADMDQINNGGAMTYENFENMRTNLAAEARKAERSGDGNRAMATSIVRDALENIPISGEAANLKPLADAARSAAKSRFDLIKNDPAYKAAINDSTSADDFINKYVVNGDVKDIKSMRANLADDPMAGQTIAAGTINFLKNRAGINGDNGNFSQAGYNKALRAVAPKINDLFESDQANQLQALGNVARYTQEQPRGSFVNNSNTLVGSIAKNVKELGLGALNIKTLGGVNFVRGKLQERATDRDVSKSVEPGAGMTRISDVH